ncbi:toxin-antitoxin system TumE family protein [Pantoea sp. RRHST58]|uniref:toxin-antitoxin system TumE family protein n=1 Tax=Pantoea sp. RRHST58 TaxID=3425183 RepID=UPI003DA12995
MPAVELMNRRIQIADNAFATIRILQVAPAILGSKHQYKYSLAYIVEGVCVMRYDNERGK